MVFKFYRMKSRVLIFLTAICILLLGSGFYSLSKARMKASFYLLQDSVYVTVDKAPIFKKNNGNVQKFLNKEVSYPIDAVAEGLEGKVLVTCVVTANGNMVNPHIEKGLSESLDKEALRAVSLMKYWKPGIVDGNKVDTKLTIPVNFYLSEENKKIAQQLKPFYEAGKKPPLFILDKKKVTGLSVVEYYNVKSIRVLKGQKAIDLYGQEGRNGVVVIETKQVTDPFYKRY